MDIDRILTWSIERYTGQPIMMPAYYLEDTYAPVTVRIFAEQIPTADDATFDIFDDGVSINYDRDRDVMDSVTGTLVRHTPNTKMALDKGESEDLDAGDFTEDGTLESGSWITCKIYSDGGGRFFTVQLELRKFSEVDADEVD